MDDACTDGGTAVTATPNSSTRRTERVTRSSSRRRASRERRGHDDPAPTFTQGPSALPSPTTERTTSSFKAAGWPGSGVTSSHESRRFFRPAILTRDTSLVAPFEVVLSLRRSRHAQTAHQNDLFPCRLGTGGCTGQIGDPAETVGADPGGAPAPVALVSGCTTLNPGPSMLRRLTRFEYNNTVSDLLGDTTAPPIASLRRAITGFRQ